MCTAREIRAARTTQVKRDYVTKGRVCMLQSKALTPAQRAYHRLTTRHSFPHMLSPIHCDGKQLEQLQCASLSAEWQRGPDLMSRSMMKSFFQLCLLLIRHGCLLTHWSAMLERNWDVSIFYHLLISAHGWSGSQGAMNTLHFEHWPECQQGVIGWQLSTSLHPSVQDIWSEVRWQDQKADDRLPNATCVMGTLMFEHGVYGQP